MKKDWGRSGENWVGRKTANNIGVRWRFVARESNERGNSDGIDRNPGESNGFI